MWYPSVFIVFSCPVHPFLHMSNVFVHFVLEPVDMNCFEENNIVAMTVTSTPDYAMQHGVCKLTDSVSPNKAQSLM